MTSISVNPRVQKLILERLRARQARERLQRQLIPDVDLHHAEICRKLAGLCETSQFQNVLRCGDEQIYRTCKCCGKVETFDYRCCVKWCPRCQWRITKEREKVVAAWSARIRQPKHLVLTQKNFPILTRGRLREHLAAMRKFRRLKLFSGVRGGCVSVEVTRSDSGWHLHSHWLLDCDWLDISQVSIEWGNLVGQHFAIVKIKDVRSGDYVQELIKYLAKGSDISQWPAELILEFVTAIRGKRFFFAFGSLFKQGGEVRQQLKFLKPARAACDCGAKEFQFETELQAVLNEVRKSRRK